MWAGQKQTVAHAREAFALCMARQHHGRRLIHGTAAAAILATSQTRTHPDMLHKGDNSRLDPKVRIKKFHCLVTPDRQRGRTAMHREVTCGRY
jgi:hypothetical protein